MQEIVVIFFLLGDGEFGVTEREGRDYTDNLQKITNTKEMMKKLFHVFSSIFFVIIFSSCALRNEDALYDLVDRYELDFLMENILVNLI